MNHYKITLVNSVTSKTTSIVVYGILIKKPKYIKLYNQYDVELLRMSNILYTKVELI